MKKKAYLIFLAFIFTLLAVQTVNAGIIAILNSPTTGWYNTYSILLDITTSDNANVTFNTTKYLIPTFIFTNNTQGSLTLNSTFLDEGNNTIYIQATNATNASDTYEVNVVNIAVDVSAPVWDQMPQSQTSEYGSVFLYDTNASDLRTIAYSIDDTTNFAVNSNNGIITNNTALSIGNYILEINATDASNNINSSTITISVQDTTAPTWDQTPTNQNVNDGSAFSYDVTASDLTTVIYSINNTADFTINSATGTITNATSLSVGSYSLNISVNDTSNNILSKVITITVTACSESWSCTDWSTCSGGTQTRTCTDANSCGTTDDKPDVSRSCDSGSSSGGGGASYTDISIVGEKLSYFWDLIDAGESIVVNILEEEIPVNKLEIEMANAVTDVYLSVAVLTEAPETDEALTKKSYNYLEIIKENIEEEDISNAVIEFTVEKSWLINNEVDEEAVVLMRYDDGWDELSTRKIISTANDVIYEADVSGFSYFAIAAEEVEEEDTTVLEETPDEATIAVEDEETVLEEELSAEDKKEEQPETKQKKIILSSLAVLGIAILIVGIVYLFFLKIRD